MTAIAEGSSAWSLGKVDQSFVWSPATNIVGDVDKCAFTLVKTRPPNRETAQSADDPEQTCLLRIMRDSGAQANAVAFTRWFYESSKLGESGFIDKIIAGTHGPVSAAKMEFPGRANNNWEFVFVNGTPHVMNPMDVWAGKATPWDDYAPYQALLRDHPKAWIFPAQDLVGETELAGGGQRFTLAVPIVDGCHACAVLGYAYIGFDFGALGGWQGVTMVAIRRCPGDPRCR